jgi:benzoate transport
MEMREAIRTQPMRRLQITIIALCTLLTMIDGYEVLVMALVAPHLAKAWTLGSVQVGYLLSAGVFGMAVGAALISPLADAIGRRRHIIVCLSMIAVGMGLSAIATSVAQLLAFRAFAGLFIGAIISSLNIVASEYSSARRRGTAMGIYGIGLPLGSALGGAVTSPLIQQYGWRAPFVFGALLTVVALALVVFALPESIEYLVEKRPRRALEQYNRIAARLGCASAAVLPPPVTSRRMEVVRMALFTDIMLWRTGFLWLGYACLIAAFYFSNTWTAKLIADASGDPALGIRTTVFIQVGGVFGSLVFAALSLVIRPRLATALILFGGTIAYVLYANQLHHVDAALALALLVGLGANGGVAAFYAISPSVYATVHRSKGVGLMIAFGRGVAIFVPIFTGYVLKAGWTPHDAYQLFAGVLLFAGVATVLLDRTYRGRSENPDTSEATEWSPATSVRVSA